MLRGQTLECQTLCLREEWIKARINLAADLV